MSHQPLAPHVQSALGALWGGAELDVVQLYYSMSGAPAGPISMLPLLPWSVGVGIIRGGFLGKGPPHKE